MAKHKRKFRTIPILLSLLIITVVVGVGIKTLPFFTSSSSQQIAAATCDRLHFERAMLDKEGLSVNLWFKLDNPTNKEAGGLDSMGNVTKATANVAGNIEELDLLRDGKIFANMAPTNNSVSGTAPVEAFEEGTAIQVTYSAGGQTCETVNALVFPYNVFIDPNVGEKPPLISIAPPKPIDTSSCITYSNGNFSICPGVVTEGTRMVKPLVMYNIPLKEGDTETTKWWYCLRSEPAECSGDDFHGTNDTGRKVTQKGNPGGKTQNVTFGELCGDGENKLKQSCAADGSDYFHAGKTYRVTIFEKNEKGSPIIQSASFYVSHFYPEIVKPLATTAKDKDGKFVDSSLILTSIPSGYNIEVELSGRDNKEGGQKANKYNDYWVRFEGFDVEYKSQSKCIYIPNSQDETGKTTLNIPLMSADSQRLTEGRYIIKIKDGARGNESTTDPKCNEGDFTYYFIPVVIGSTERPGYIGKKITDPNGQEGQLAGARVSLAPLCPPEDMSPQGYCTSIATALGSKISTEPQFFVRDIFTLVLSIGGIAAVVFFIQAGYTLMTSAGSKDKVGAAREQMTSAIMGLIFIILSVTILEFIGINILHLPGFAP